MGSPVLGAVAVTVSKGAVPSLHGLLPGDNTENKKQWFHRQRWEGRKKQRLSKCIMLCWRVLLPQAFFPETPLTTIISNISSFQPELRNCFKTVKTKV